MGIQVYFNGGNNIRNLLMTPKDKDTITYKTKVTFKYRCDRLACDEEHIGESTKTFGIRLKEHFREPFPIYDYTNTTRSPYQ